MKKSYVLAVLVLLSVVSLFGSAFAETGAEKVAVSAAKTWLSLVDKGRYGESWQEASAYFRGAVSREQFQSSLEGVRKPLGGLVSRKLKTAKSMTEVPGAPDGRYVVMEFHTSFVNKKSAVETVTFMLEKDGKWRAAGYFIR